MQKLFTLLRQGNFDELKRIITNKPELLNSVSGPKPKKDHGQSLLQVAFKAGKFDIADFLIESGIDVNFMEAEDDDSGVRAPVLFDAITAVLMSLCVNKYSSKEEVEGKFTESDRALLLMKKMISLGADVTKRTSNIMDSPSAYPYSQEKVREQLTLILDCLFENGADYMEWLEEGYYPEPCPGPSVKDTFWCDLELVKVKNERYMSMREYLHSYFSDRNI